MIKFKQYHRFNEPYWFSGIYKISRYTWHKRGECAPYYHVYYLTGKNWGDYVGGKPTQYDAQLTFNECVKLANEHAKTYAPTKKQLEQAEIAKNSWLGMDKSA